MNINSSGYIVTADVSSIKDIACDEVWQITRSSNHIPGTVWMPDLAPSPQLFKKYLYEWKDRPCEEWWDMYREIFEQEIKSDYKKVSALKKAFNLVNLGKVIAMVCFCRDSRYCHRTLVGNFLKQKGIRVEEYVSKRASEDNVQQLTLF